MRSDVHGALIGLLIARGGPRCELIHAGERPWASITFEGARHSVELAMSADATAAFLDGIEEADFDLRGHLLADLAVAERGLGADGTMRIRLEALTLVDR